MILCLLPQACKDKVVDKEEPKTILDSIKDQTTPEAVLVNFNLIYNFTQNGIGVEKAIELYRNCFSNDVTGPQYQFVYKGISCGICDGSNNYMSFTEEMRSTANLFRRVAQDSLNLDLRHFQTIWSWTEFAADTVMQQVKHPNEDWYYFSVGAWMCMNNPDPSLDPFLVNGKVEFYIRLCSDSKYRIVHWTDRSFDCITPKNANQNVSKPQCQSAWSELKLLF